MEKLQDMGEHEAIRRLSMMLGRHPDLSTGVGDDCAVCSVPGTGSDQVFTTDAVIERVHFEEGEIPERIGHKAVGRILSDIAAMGAQPQWILVNVVASPEQDFDIIERVYQGMISLCKSFGATIIGGDLAQGPSLEFHVFGTGLLPAGSAVLRSGAGPGDVLCVTGPLGCSISGKHLDFIPRIDEGIFLRKTGWVTAMMDISDGLATDLRHILRQSNVGAILSTEQLPLNGTLEEALYDGEDFELLFTVPPERYPELCRQWTNQFKTDLFGIGVITEAIDTLQLKKPDGTVETVRAKAFEHFQ